MNKYTFIKKLTKLNVDRSKGAPAPHKAILLLAIIQAIENNEIKENKIFITPELVARFKDIWHSVVRSEKFNPNFSLPFYHLKSDGFWHLKTLTGREILLTSSSSIKSFAALRNAIDYASFDDEVFFLLNNQIDREAIKEILLVTYLPGQQSINNGYNLFYEIENQILHEPANLYKMEIAKADEEENFIRGGVFKKTIPKIYNYTCCMSGMRIIASFDVQMIDACHIVPFSESHDDTISNGISLSPNLHRAFDRFLITINNDLEIVVSKHFTESGNHSIREFHGNKIYLPSDPQYQPSRHNINWHFQKFIQYNTTW